MSVSSVNPPSLCLILGTVTAWALSGGGSTEIREREELLMGSFQEKLASERRGTYWGIYGARNKVKVGTASSKVSIGCCHGNDKFHVTIGGSKGRFA